MTDRPTTEAVVMIGVGIVLLALGTAPWAAWWVPVAGGTIFAIASVLFAGILITRSLPRSSTDTASEVEG